MYSIYICIYIIYTFIYSKIERRRERERERDTRYTIVSGMINENVGTIQLPLVLPERFESCRGAHQDKQQAYPETEYT